jgi:hypothetical protein
MGFRFPVPGKREIIPQLKDRYVRPIYLLDWPSFTQRPLSAAGWQLCASVSTSQTRAVPAARAPAGDPLLHLERTAELIKAYARQGKTEPPTILVPDQQAELFTYVVAKLLWNPFLDTSRLIGEFSR